MLNMGKQCLHVGVYSFIFSVILFSVRISFNNQVIKFSGLPNKSNGISFLDQIRSLNWSIENSSSEWTWTASRKQSIENSSNEPTTNLKEPNENSSSVFTVNKNESRENSSNESSKNSPNELTTNINESGENSSNEFGENASNKTVIVGIGIPKAGSNKLDSIISKSFNLVSCNEVWANLSLNSARASIYCSWGKTISDPFVKEDVLRRLGRECGYLGTHQDLSIGRQLEGFNVSYVTILRDPISRLVSGCNYDLGKKCNYKTIVHFARTNRGYGLPNRMTKMIAGLDPVCSLQYINRSVLTDEQVLQVAKTNLKKFLFVGILERLNESIALLPSPVSIPNVVVFPRQVSRGGSFKGDRDKLTRLLRPYVNLDQQLYRYANQLLDQRLLQYGHKKENHVDILV